jgi:hypothetical protein
MNLDKIIKEQLNKYVKGKVISEMATVSSYCKKAFSSISAEFHFCNAAEDYIKNEIETVGRFKKKVIFDKFRKGVSNFFDSEQGNNELEIKIENITEEHPIMKEGIEEVKAIDSLISDNCSKVMTVFERQVANLKDKVQLYFTENDKYSITNRLDTNYSAIAVLFTKFFQNKGALDSVEGGVDTLNWDLIANNWINHAFNPSIKFIDIRNESDKLDRTQVLSDLGFNELCRIYFKNVVVFNSNDIRASVNHVLKDVRERGFSSENAFEKNYLQNKRDFMRLAKDYGFADRYLGIDFIYKGKDYWVPVQVKSSPQEATYLISSLGCKTYVIAEKTGKTFKINTLHSGELSH